MNMNTAPPRIMVDLETLGTTPGSAIVSIGAVKFSLEGLGDTFYERIDLTSNVKHGLTISPDTVKWWLGQSDEARAELISLDCIDLPVALARFADWCNHPHAEAPDVIELWGNGANFDNSLLGAAYDKLNIAQPWKFWNDRCYRTVKALHPNMPMQKRTGTHHNALYDAISQAEHLITLPSFRAMCEMEGRAEA